MSMKSKMSTITCPKCGQTLPGWAQKCQFCGSEMHPGFVRPVDAYANRVDNRISWKEASYIVVSILITLQGIYLLLLAFNVIHNAAYALGGGTFLGVFGAVRTGLGVGMLFYQSWAQFVMKWVCVVSLFWDGLGLLVAIMRVSDPRDGVVNLLVQLFTFALVIFTLYILYSEADV